MEIDFEGLYNATKKGHIKYQKDIEEERRKIEHKVKSECAELKKIFIHLLNNDIKKQFENGTMHVVITKQVKAPTLNNYYNISSNYRYNINRTGIHNFNDLRIICSEDFNKDLFLEPFEKKTNCRIPAIELNNDGKELLVNIQNFKNLD